MDSTFGNNVALCILKNPFAACRILTNIQFKHYTALVQHAFIRIQNRKLVCVCSWHTTPLQHKSFVNCNEIIIKVICRRLEENSNVFRFGGFRCLQTFESHKMVDYYARVAHMRVCIRIHYKLFTNSKVFRQNTQDPKWRRKRSEWICDVWCMENGVSTHYEIAVLHIFSMIKSIAAVVEIVKSLDAIQTLQHHLPLFRTKIRRLFSAHCTVHCSVSSLWMGLSDRSNIEYFYIYSVLHTQKEVV